MPSRRDLLRPWILHAILNATAPVTTAPSASNNLGLVYEYHDKVGKHSDINEIWLTDGEVSVTANFENSNCYVLSSLPSSFDPSISRAPKGWSLIFVSAYRMVFSTLPSPVQINGMNFSFNVTFYIDDFGINIPDCFELGRPTDVCSQLPGVQRKAGELLKNSSLPVNLSEEAGLEKTENLSMRHKAILAEQMRSPSGSSITSSILKAVGESSKHDLALLSQLPVSQNPFFQSQENMVCITGSCSIIRRKKTQPQNVEHVCAQVPADYLEVHETEGSQLTESDSIHLQLDPDSLESSEPSQITRALTMSACSNVIPTSTATVEKLDVLSLPINGISIKPFSNSPHSKSFVDSGTPKSPLLKLTSLGKRLRKKNTPSQVSRATDSFTPSPIDDQRKSLIHSFKAGRKGKATPVLTPKLKRKESEEVPIIVVDETHSLLDAIQDFNAKSVKRKISEESLEMSGAERKRRVMVEASVVAEIPLNCTLGADSDEEQDIFSQHTTGKTQTAEEIVIVEPMTTSSQLGLIEPDDESVRSENNVNCDNTTTSSEPGPFEIDQSLKTNNNSVLIYNNNWLDTLGQEAESIFDSCWSLFSQLDSYQADDV